MRESPRQHAFTLVEILFVLSMMGVAFLLEAQLFQISVRTVAAAPAAMNQQTSLERMAASLRQDVWSAAGIEIPDRRTLILHLPDNTTCRWLFGDSEASRLIDAADPASAQRWDISLPLGVERQGAAVGLRSASARGDAIGGRWFFSQLLLAEAAK